MLPFSASRFSSLSSTALVVLLSWVSFSTHEVQAAGILEWSGRWCRNAFIRLSSPIVNTAERLGRRHSKDTSSSSRRSRHGNEIRPALDYGLKVSVGIGEELVEEGTSQRLIRQRDGQVLAERTQAEGSYKGSTIIVRTYYSPDFPDFIIHQLIDVVLDGRPMATYVQEVYPENHPTLTLLGGEERYPSPPTTKPTPRSPQIRERIRCFDEAGNPIEESIAIRAVGPNRNVLYQGRVVNTEQDGIEYVTHVNQIYPDRAAKLRAVLGRKPSPLEFLLSHFKSVEAISLLDRSWTWRSQFSEFQKLSSDG